MGARHSRILAGVPGRDTLFNMILVTVTQLSSTCESKRGRGGDGGGVMGIDTVRLIEKKRAPAESVQKQ